MALGFGFNKTKVLSSAEKFVQQGKLQNAIAEYEKVIKEDPKDLTVLNTIGDLHARVGQNEKACEYFRRVGDQYAQNGFTVKAIAIYKKLTKLVPPTADSILKLAELYSQQGLFNDARAQYMLVADQLLKAGDNNQAARMFQKVLELDPENTTTQSKLADLFIKLGRKEEARNIYYSAAESLYARNSFDAADEALGRVLSLDPANSSALLLRGMIAAGSGDSQAAIQFLERVPDLDSRPDALRSLLQAKLRSGKVEGAEALAGKLFSVHQDMSGITSLAEWSLNNDRVEDALKLYDSYAERFLALNPGALNETLYPLIGKVRENPQALATVMRLLQKAGDTSHLNEVMELLAHAYAQSQNFSQARDLYKELSVLEPENPLHFQNYKQMLGKLGQDAAIRPLSSEEGSQALMVEELEHAAPVVRQQYSSSVERAIEGALTDAELFVSYNVPQKAIAPLEAALPLAPRDVNLNQRLATLYAKAERFGQAAAVCRVLSEVFAEAGHQSEASRYANAADKYAAIAAASPVRVVEPPSVPPPRVQAVRPMPVETVPTPVEPEAATVKDFILDVSAEPAEPMPAAALVESAAEPTITAFGFEESDTAPAEATAREIDLSNEWEGMLSVEHDLPVSAPEPPAPVAAHPPVDSGPDPAVVADKIQEIQFYISQSFWDIAQSAIQDLTEIAPRTPELEELKASLAAAQAKATEQAQALSPSASAQSEPAMALESVAEPEAPALEPVAIVAPRQELEPVHPAEPLPMVSELTLEIPDALEVPDEIAPVAIQAEPVPAVSPVIPEPRVMPAAQAAPASVPPPADDADDVLGDLVLDLEESLGNDFFPAAQGKPQSPPVPQQATVAASASASPPVTSWQAAPAPVMAPASVLVETASAQAATQIPSQIPSTMNGGIQEAEATSVLSDILSELQDEMQEAEPEPEDPDTHYNLGIAFKEMGLLDEAIGELQKVCHAIELGFSFSQPIQAYTWLAQCLVDKGVPEAAVRWYQKALNLPGLDHNSRCSIYYDLGAAFESSGDRKAALANFMEVYSSNIDFRDVASRIKVLKS
jgi:tetratricopeptide (TPR) repeat protein